MYPPVSCSPVHSTVIAIHCTFLSDVLQFTLHSPPYIVPSFQLFHSSLYSPRHIFYLPVSCSPVHSTVPAIYFTFLSAVLHYTLQSPPYILPSCQLFSSSFYSLRHILYPPVSWSPVHSTVPAIYFTFLSAVLHYNLQSPPYILPSCQLFSITIYSPRHILYPPVSCSPVHSTVLAIYSHSAIALLI